MSTMLKQFVRLMASMKQANLESERITKTLADQKSLYSQQRYKPGFPKTCIPPSSIILSPLNFEFWKIH